MLRIARAVAILASTGLCACALDPYACESSEQCRRDGRDGVCEDIGFCSYPDDACPSGARFSPNAGEDLASQCVDVDVGSTGVSTTTGTTTSDGPGCDSDCQPSGEVVWSLDWTDVSAVDLAVFGDRVVVVAAAADPQGSPIPWLTAVDDAGNEVWTPLQLDARAGVEPTAAAAVSDGLTIVGREATTNVGGQRAWLARVDAAGAVESQDVIDTLADESFVAAAASGDLVAAVGARADDGWILWGPTVESTIAGLIPSAAAGRADGVLGVVGTILPSDTRWTLLLPGGQSLAQGGIEAEELRAIAFGPNGGYFVSGRRAGRPFLAAFAADGSAQWATDLDPSGGTALDVIADPATGDPFVAISNASTGSLSRLDDGGQPRWTTPLRIDGMDVVPVAVVTDPTGVVFVAGNRGSDATLARLTP